MRVFVLSAACSELRAVHTFSSNSPSLHLTCADWSRRTSEQKSTGMNASWEVLDISFVLIAGSQFTVRVFSGKKLVGMDMISAEKMILSPVDSAGQAELRLTLMHKGLPAGTVSILLCFSPLTPQELQNLGEEGAVEGGDYHITNLTGGGLLSTSEPTLSSSPWISSQSFKPPLSPLALASDEVVISYASLTSNTSQQYNIRLKFIDFSSADLRPVHTLGPNSPCLTISYGDRSNTTHTL